MKATKIGEGVYVQKYNQKGASVAILTGGKQGKVLDADEGSRVGGTADWYIKRGSNNKKLLEFLDMLGESPNKWQFLGTKANFVYGRGIAIFEEDEDAKSVPMPLRSESFFEWRKKLKLNKVALAAAAQVVFSYELNLYVKLDSQTKKIQEVRVIDNNHIRAQRVKDGETKVKGYWLNSNFGRIDVKKADAEYVPAYDPSNPTRHGKFIIHEIVPTPGQIFYGNAPWWGTKSWSDAANNVPKFYEAAFKNGFFVTHHVIIPDDYWDVENKSEEEIKLEKETTINNISEVLSSVEESNKVIYTFSKLQADNKISSSIKIEPIEFNIKDEAFIKMFNVANQVQASGHGLPGKLAGVEFGNSLGTSGKEIATLADYVQNFLVTQERRCVLDAFEVLQKIDEVEMDKVLGFKNITTYVFDSVPVSGEVEDNVNSEENAN
jgi:hypothetical protein